MKPLSDTTSTKKRIAYAAAAATLFAPASVVGDASSSLPNAAGAPKPMMTGAATGNLHETLWGNPPVWEDEDVYTRDPSSTLNIPRGGTDESSPKNKKDKKKKKKRNNKAESHSKPNKDKDKKKKKEKTDRPKEEEVEEEEENPYTNPIMEDILRKDNFYDILGVSRGEDNHARIKKAYRRRAVQTHPDKTGGDRRAFDKLAEAYEVLLDDDKRVIYDRYGKEGLDPTRGPVAGRGASAEDMFRSFFGGGPPQQRPPTVNRTVRYQLQVSLEELYRGKTKPVTVEAPRGNSFYAQFEPPSAKKQVQVMIPRGAHPGQSIVLSGEMDFDSKDSPPGDLIFQLQVRPHKSFTRKGHDLALEQTISFREAICGFTRRFQHLSGKYMTVESAKHPTLLSDLEPPTTTTTGEGEESNGEVAVLDTPQPTAPAHIFIKTGDVQVLKGKGMPKNPQGTEFGDLYIQYNVELPRAGRTDNLTPTERQELARLLEKLEGKSSSSSSSSNHKAKETFTLEPARASDFGRASGPIHMTEEDPHSHMDEQHHQQQQHQFPFGGTGHRQFFFSSNGGSPFFGQQQNFEDDENVQCRQM